MNTSASERTRSSRQGNKVMAFLSWLFLLLTSYRRGGASERDRNQYDQQSTSHNRNGTNGTSKGKNESKKKKGSFFKKVFGKGRNSTKNGAPEAVDRRGPEPSESRSLDLTSGPAHPTQCSVGTQTSASRDPLPVKNKELLWKKLMNKLRRKSPVGKNRMDSTPIPEPTQETSQAGPSNSTPPPGPSSPFATTPKPASKTPLPPRPSLPKEVKDSSVPSTPAEASGQKKKAKRCDTEVVLTILTTAPPTGQEVNGSGGSSLPETSSRKMVEDEQAQDTVVIQIENPEPEERWRWWRPCRPRTCLPWLTPVRTLVIIYSIIFTGAMLGMFLYHHSVIKNI